MNRAVSFLRRYLLSVPRRGSLRIWIQRLLICVAITILLHLENTRHHRHRYRRSLGGVSCVNLIRNDQEEQAKTLHFLRSYSLSQISADAYLKLTENCSSFISSRGYFPRKVMKQEREFPIAFGILIYKDLELAERLLRAIYRSHNYYCLHLDSKAPPRMREALIAIASCLNNVFLASESFDVEWGKIAVLQAELQCMKDLRKHGKWEYFINLTGHEFPLKTNLELVEILKAYDGANDIHSDTDLARKYKHWTSYSWSNYRIHSSWQKSPPPSGIRLAKGEAHVVVTRDFVDYVITDPTAAYFYEWIQDIRVPDEFYFQSLNINKQLGVPGAHNGSFGTQSVARYKRWVYDNYHEECGGKVVRNVCNFGIRDLPSIVRAPQLFANKFTLEYEPVTHRCVEKWLAEKEEREGVDDIDIDFYKQLPFVKARKIFAKE